MAPETFYYIFSLSATLLLLLHITNMFYFRLKKETLFGQVYGHNTIEHEKLIKLSSSKNIFFISVILVAVTINLIYDINRILGFNNPDYARGVLIYITLGVILFFIIMTLLLRRKLKNVQ